MTARLNYNDSCYMPEREIKGINSITNGSFVTLRLYAHALVSVLKIEHSATPRVLFSSPQPVSSCVVSQGT